jgi:hypothetical protein
MLREIAVTGEAWRRSRRGRALRVVYFVSRSADIVLK